MKRPKLIYLLIGFIAILLSGCSTKAYLPGKYASKDNYNKFLFKKDSTFLAEYTSGHASSYAKGTWKTKNGLVVLNTYPGNVTVPVKVMPITKSSADSVQIEINFTVVNGLPLNNYVCQVHANNRLIFGLQGIRCDSLKAFKLSRHATNFYLSFIKQQPHNPINYNFPLTTDVISLHDNNILLDVTINDSNFKHLALNNTTVKVKRRSIEMFNSHSNKWEVIPKVSSKTKIFRNFQD